MQHLELGEHQQNWENEMSWDKFNNLPNGCAICDDYMSTDDRHKMYYAVNAPFGQELGKNQIVHKDCGMSCGMEFAQ